MTRCSKDFSASIWNGYLALKGNEMDKNLYVVIMFRHLPQDLRFSEAPSPQIIEAAPF